MQRWRSTAALAIATAAFASACADAGRTPAPPAPPRAGGPIVSYRVRADRLDTLQVAVSADDPRFQRLTIEDDAEGFIESLRAGPAGAELEPIVPGAWPLSLPVCAGPCEIRYDFDLAGVARAFKNPQFAALWERAILAPPTTFLLRPTELGGGAFTLDVEPRGEALSFACGLARDADGAFVAGLDDLPKAPYAALGELHAHELLVGDADLHVVRVGAEPRVGDEALVRWVRAAAEDLAAYFDGYPQKSAVVFVLTDDGAGISNGFSLGNGGAAVLVEVGTDTDEETFARDWIMTHELVHIASPSLPRAHNWMEEGLATYLEPIARARRGHETPEGVWGPWFHQMWQGQPMADDGGLDGTSSWGRLYWGGAGFWLLAELSIFEQTRGEKSLTDCLRSVARAGGTIAKRWPAARYLEACDAGLGAPIVSRLYADLAARPVALDLDGVFARLGVHKAPGGVRFDDDAPAAALRRRLTP